MTSPLSSSSSLRGNLQLFNKQFGQLGLVGQGGKSSWTDEYWSKLTPLHSFSTQAMTASIVLLGKGRPCELNTVDNKLVNHAYSLVFSVQRQVCSWLRSMTTLRKTGRPMQVKDKVIVVHLFSVFFFFEHIKT